MRYLITFSYDGSAFMGYQRQKDLKTVQGSIEKILTDINNKTVDIHSSGRTDKGVHAINQKAHFDLDKNISLYNIKKALNNALKGEIFIKEVEIVNDDFHARYNVLEKTYEYLINTKYYNPLKRNYEYQYNKSLDIKKMNKALKHFLGEHDFRSFCSNQKDKENCVRIIKSTSIIESNEILKITITGNGFLRKMIRNIVGLLIEIGSGKKEVDEVLKLLNSKGKIHNKKSAPACGLYLTDISFNLL